MSAGAGFIIKKALGTLVMPLSICLLLFALGMIYVLLRRSKDAIAPFVLAGLLLYAFSLNTVSGYLIRPLERAYPPLNLTSAEMTKTRVKWVVVLGSGHWTDKSLPPGAMLEEAALYRLTEGIRIANRFPGAILVLSGGKFRDEQSSAQVMAAAAVGLGFDPGRIMLSDKALDTHDEAVHVKTLAGSDAFVLVTSASHMLRAVKLFENQGLRPIPAPAYYRSKGEPEYFIPGATNIKTCHMAVHEYLGLAWSFVRGQISIAQ
ncbi:MAG: YdcF family protein [Desulfomicrobium sp.]|nr:YdcF family protein [Pseudomonadota bacterium]MBV1712167.1 YdcF family protein [Desulfomicrobium sp.]MBU4572805.1 YdcF family protein [Pseudomonadota bacterium]MBU4594800.1 YdcF family protein [Pseudomonadota bacterium]MBV1718561.1 YdcF family protein [Desulfomicrobium sp.]